MKLSKLILTIFVSFFCSTLFANSIEFFASNNTNEIDLQTAFNRLEGDEQQALQLSTINLMQKNRLEQGSFEDLLGTYKMSTDQNITADNSEIYITSPYQNLSTEKVFMLAKQLANTLKQDSIAVFIPSKQAVIGDIIIKFKSHAYTINETINLIQSKLPAQYSQAFSLYLNHSCADFNNTTVNEIEWLGSKIKLDDIKKAFPLEDITYHYGKAYLVYRNGQKEPL